MTGLEKHGFHTKFYENSSAASKFFGSRETDTTDNSQSVIKQRWKAVFCEVHSHSKCVLHVLSRGLLLLQRDPRDCCAFDYCCTNVAIGH